MFEILDVAPRKDPALALRRWTSDGAQDLVYALRQMRREPGLALLIVATLAIGIGANATMAGAIDRLVNRPPPQIPTPERVVRLFGASTWQGVERAGPYSNYPELLNLHQYVSAFEDVAAFSPSMAWFGSGADAVQIRTSLVSPSFFAVLGVRPALGRVFTREDGFPTGPSAGGPALAVIGHDFWQRQFAGARDVIGQSIRLGTRTYTIAGVVPRGFRGVELEAPDVFLPMTVTAGAEGKPALHDTESSWIQIIARLRPGVSHDVAQQEATDVSRRQDRSVDRATTRPRIILASLIRGRAPDAPHEVKVALWLGGVSVLVLLIACANVTNLLLARAFTRRREIAVRLALGASRGRLSRQMLVEAGLFALLGGGAALCLAELGGGVLQHLLAIPNDGGSFVDARVFVFTAGIALGAVVLVSLVPLTQGSALNLTEALHSGGGGGGGRRAPVRSVLLGVQAALCMMLLVGAGLFAQSLRRVRALDLGVNVERTWVASFDSRRGGLPEPVLDAMDQEIMRRVRAIPGVARAAFAEWNPSQGGRAVAIHTPAHDADFYLEGRFYPPMLSAVDSGFFATVGASLRGRDFSASDNVGSSPVAIINEPTARLLWPREEALGRCIILPLRSSDRGGPCVTVVGVVGGYWYQSILDRDRPLVYVPLAQRRPGVGRPGTLFMVLSGDPTAIVPAVRRAIAGVRPNLPGVRVVPVSDAIDPQMRPWRLGAMMFSLFGGVALVIAMIGLYAVVSFTAAQRSSEIAVRVALGARGRNVLSAVAGDSLFAATVGLGIGVAVTLVARQWIGPLLYQTSPGDPRVILGVAGILLTVAGLAVLIPTARLLRQSPAAVLRIDH
jgi:predicted permease